MGEITPDNPLGLPPPMFPDDLGRGPMIMGVTWTFAILALAVVVLRFVIRAKITRCLSIDDWLMLVAVMLLLTFQGILTQSFRLGMGKRDMNLTWVQTKGILKWTFVSLIPLNAASVVARLSITVMLLRIFGRNKWFKAYLITLTTLSVIAIFIVVIFVWASASPVEGLWDPLLPARRWDPRLPLYAAYAAGSIIALTDLTFVFWPVFIIWNLRMPTRQKAGLSLLMVGSIFTVAMSIMKTYYAQANPHSSTDLQYYASLSNLWSSLEASVVILMGSVPPLRPLANLEFPTLRSVGSLVTGSLDSLSSQRSRTSSTSGGGTAKASSETAQVGLTSKSNLSYIRKTDDHHVSYA